MSNLYINYRNGDRVYPAGEWYISTTDKSLWIRCYIYKLFGIFPIGYTWYDADDLREVNVCGK